MYSARTSDYNIKNKMNIKDIHSTVEHGEAGGKEELKE
ncbi:hypothetical protein M2092_000165 [Fusobacterium sp. PH5-44]